MKVGFVGLGVMGVPMARHLAEGGHDLVLFDVNTAQTKRATKAVPRSKGVSSLADLASASDVVITMLPNGQVVQDVVFGANGLAAGLQCGQLLIDTSSAEPHLTRETHGRLAALGVSLVDAPVSGAQEGAESGTLVFMVGGAADEVERARPLLSLMGRHIHHVGDVGAGHVMKSVNNLITAVTWLATAEGMLIGRAQGLDPTAMVDVLNVSTGMNFITQRKMASEVLSRRFADPFKLAFMVKDIGIATALASEVRVPIPVGALTEQLWHAANRAQGDGASITEIVRWCEDMAGVALETDGR